MGSGVTPLIPTRCWGGVAHGKSVGGCGGSEHGRGCVAAPHIPGWHLPLQHLGTVTRWPRTSTAAETHRPTAHILGERAKPPWGWGRAGCDPTGNLTEPSPKASIAETLTATTVHRRGRLCRAGTVIPRDREFGCGGAAPARSIARTHERWERFVLFFLSW